jgi:serine/threonine protein kinase
MDELRPIIAGKYEIEWEVDHGAMGRVFAATQLGLERAVAIKIMSESGRAFRERFLVEARALASLNHRNIVTIYDSGELEDGVVFIAMEYLRGQTLADALKRARRFDVVRTLHIAVQMTRGLRAAHKQGIVHRDLKPSNVFLVEDDDADDPSDGTSGELVKLFDFGIAKTLPMSRDHVVTREGAIMGTPAYMAPEQVEGRAVDARSDLYALGCVLFQLLTGRTPFVASNNVELMLAHLHKVPPMLRTLRPEVPTPIEDVVMRLLSRDPRDRYADADALLPVLKELLVVFGGEAFRRQSTDVFGADVPPPRAAVHRGELPRTESPSPRTPLHLPHVAHLSQPNETLPLAHTAYTDPGMAAAMPRRTTDAWVPPVVVGALVAPARTHRGPALVASLAAAIALFALIAMWGDDAWALALRAARIVTAGAGAAAETGR